MWQQTIMNSADNSPDPLAPMQKILLRVQDNESFVHMANEYYCRTNKGTQQHTFPCLLII